MIHLSISLLKLWRAQLVGAVSFGTIPARQAAAAVRNIAPPSLFSGV
jgi:hypothetical protein